MSSPKTQILTSLMPWVITLILLCPLPVAIAAVIHVPADYDTIQEAISNAAHGDEIVVASGVYVDRIDFLGLAIIVRSSDGSATTIIDVSALGGTAVTFSSGEGRSTILMGFTITGGDNTGYGGGMLCDNSSPLIIDCIFVQNSALNGGGIANDHNANPYIVGCQFIDNTAANGAGVFLINGSNASITTSVFRDNTATDDGGAIGLAADTSIRVDSCTFLNNQVPSGDAGYEGGGAISLGWTATADLLNSTFMKNYAHDGGGALAMWDNTVTIDGCVFAGNLTDGNGGAIRVESGTGPTITNSEFCSNLMGDVSGGWSDGGGNTFSVTCAPCDADFTLDGQVNTLDFLAYLNAWTAGCP